MKKSVIILAFLTLNLPTGQAGFQLLTFNCCAQPNGGFENWSSVSSIQEPDDWQTLNFLSLFSPANPVSAFKATGVDKHSGNYALKLKTVFLNNNPAPSQLDDTTGGVFKGKVNLAPPSLQFGFVYTQRPEKLEFWAKYFPIGNDSARALVSLTKWNGTRSDTVAYGELAFGQTVFYSLFQVNLTYFSTALPDSALIGFRSAGKASKARVGSTLYLDDVTLTGWVGIDNHMIKSTGNVKTYPNPAKDNTTIHSEIADADNIQVTDIAGKLLGVYKMQNFNTTINTSAFDVGLYLYDIRDKKNKILTQGKFNVIK